MSQASIEHLVVPARTRSNASALATYWGLVGLFAGLKLCYSLAVPGNMDEAYYFLWGLHPQASYLDHSPMVGWTSGAARLLFGWGPAALHLPALLSFAAVLATLRYWFARRQPSDWALPLARTVLILVASPLLNILTTLNYPDHLLILFSLLAVAQLSFYLDAVGSGEEKLADLYSGALFLGLAALSKYSAVFLGLALVATILASPRLRALLRSSHLYLAGLLTLACTVPVIWWNIDNHLASLTLHSASRYRGDASSFGIAGPVRLIGLTIVYVSPFLFWTLARLVWRPASGTSSAVRDLGRWSLFFCGPLMLALSTWSAAAGQVSPHWLVVCLVPLVLSVEAAFRGRWQLWLHTAYGLFAMAVLTLYYLGAPLSYSWAFPRDGEAALTFGQDQVAARVRAYAREHDASLIVLHYYGDAAKLAVALEDDRQIITVNPVPDQFTLWHAGERPEGQDAIVVLRPGVTPDRFREHFETIEELPPLTTTRLGAPLAEYRFLLGRGFRP